MRKHYFPLRLKAQSGCGALLQWLVSRMPEGGQGRESPEDDWATTSLLLRAFFAAPRGAAFNRVFTAGELLGELIESGTGDPFRWSAARVRMALDSVHVDDCSDVDSLSILPDMLRSFIPVAHLLGGIRSELTDRALAAIDEAEHGFRVRIAEELLLWDDESA